MSQTEGERQPTHVYDCVSARDGIVSGAVTVTLLGDAAGQTARLGWISAQGVERTEGPHDIAAALARARKIAAGAGISRICVALEPGAVWNEDWGLLRSPQMEKEPLGDLRTAAPTQGEKMRDDEYFTAALIQELERDA